MALFHRATVTPSKAELIAAWAPTRSWGPPPGVGLEVIGSYRLDDPEGRVGLEVHLLRAGDVVLQIPLTYRDEPLAGADDALIGTMEHSVLGTRWTYDGLRDPRLVMVLAGVALTGQGEALGMVQVDGRWVVVPSAVRIHGGGWAERMAPIDGLVLERDDASGAWFRGDRFDLLVHRRVEAGPQPAIGITATWNAQPTPVALAEIRVHDTPAR